MELDKKVIVLAARADGQIAASYGLCVFSIDLAVFDDGLATEAMDVTDFGDVFSQRSMDETHRSIVRTPNTID